MKSDDTCPVCGKGDSELFMAGHGADGEEVWGSHAVSHLDCVLHACSWDGVEEYIDRVYPAKVFDGSSGDPGPRLLVMLRRAEQAEAEVERLRHANQVLFDADVKRTEKYLELYDEVARLKWMLQQAATTFVHHVADDNGIDNADDDDVAEYVADLARRYEEAQRD